MNELLLLLAGLIAVFGLVYLLYINQGCPRIGKNKNRIKASFTSCRGTVKRVVRLQPGKRYHFVFSSVLTKGTVCVEIRDRKRDNLVVLDQEHPSAILSVEPGDRLYVTTRFTGADGKYELSWDLQE